MKNIKNIVFDLGGVIITLNRDEAVRRFLEIGVDSAEELLDPYHQKGIFLELEEGKISKQEFYDQLKKIAGKEIPDDRIDYAWFGFLQDIPAYKLKMLEELRERYNLYLLSNTNPIIMGWARSPEFTEKGKSLDKYFDKLYLSYEMGVTKPHQSIFEHMIKDSGIDPSETLFIDDGLSNIEIGEKFGMKTFQPKNGEDFRYIFEE